MEKLANKTISAHEQEIDVALVGNPNTGKSSVFNALTGMRQKIGNYPGVTVEKKTGIMVTDKGKRVRVNDLPGLYSLVPKSLDDKVAADALTGRSRELSNLKLIVVVADASNLSRNLYLLTQIIELGHPVLCVLNMVDTAAASGLEIDADELTKQLSIEVVPVIARKGSGITQLKAKISQMVESADGPTAGLSLPEDIARIVAPIRDWISEHHDLNTKAAFAEAVRIISNEYALGLWLASNGYPANGDHQSLRRLVEDARHTLDGKGLNWRMLETNRRYEWIDRICRRVIQEKSEQEKSISEKIDVVLTHRIGGPLIFLLIFAVVFQAIFTWAEVPMTMIENGIGWFSQQVANLLPDGVLEDMIVEGAIAGVGAILVFLPQILFLFFFLSLLEDTGYMARVAFIMDRFMRGAGLSGRSVIPLLSSFACAIPGIMATRTIRSARDRLITIMIAPFMSCSARLPVYALMIGAFIPSITYLGIFSLPGFTLLAMYLIGIIAAILSANVMNRVVARRERPSSFYMELPPYRLPNLRWTGMQMVERAKIFITDAGKIILAISIVLWFMASYPKPDTPGVSPAEAIQQSYAGQIGHTIEPVIEPLGFNWKLGIGLITSFAAREVMVSTLATIYNVEGADEDSANLRESLRNERDPETGRRTYTPLVAVSLMVFFVLACQCMATVAVVKRETNSWRWPIAMVVWMTALAYLGSLVVYQGGKFLGFV